MSEAILFRDPDYGALALIQDGREFVVIDHGSIDTARLNSVLQVQAKRRPAASPSESRWAPTAHPKIILANIDRAMRDGGYGDDPLGERAIMVVPLRSARTPDLPARGKVYVSEAVERAVSAQLDAALARVMPHLPGPVESVSLTPYPRPFYRNERTRAPLPFFVARAQVRLAEDKIPQKRHGKTTTAQGPGVSDGTTGPKKRHGKKTIIEHWRAALKPLEESLVRATAVITERTVDYYWSFPTYEAAADFIDWVYDWHDRYVDESQPVPEPHKVKGRWGIGITFKGDAGRSILAKVKGLGGKPEWAHECQVRHPGILVLEAAICPPVVVLETFEAAELPAFQSHVIQGYRLAQIELQTPLSEEALAHVRTRADACTGAYQMETEGSVLTVAVPSSMVGYHLGDQAFRDRVNWLMQEVAEHGPTLEWVGDMKEGAPPIPKPPGELNEATETYTVIQRFRTEYGKVLRPGDKLSISLGRGHAWVSQRGTGLPEKTPINDAEIRYALERGLIE